MPRKKREETVPIKIPEGMELMIEEFLGSQEAMEHGFNNMSDLVTGALQRLLKEHGYHPKKKAFRLKSPEPK